MKSYKSQCIFSLSLFFACAIFQFRIVRTCQNYNTDTLLCSCADGGFLPTELRPYIYSLIILDSNLESLTPYDFSTLVNLQSLTIDRSIISLSEGINLLGYLKHLTNLDIINSNLTVKVMTLFSSGENIKKLSLPQNRLNHIPKGFFRNLPKVESVDLRYNEIERVEIEAFKELENLLDIDLSHNRIDDMNFNPYFFSFDSTCTYCTGHLVPTRCPDHAAEKCRGNEKVDHLWAMFAKRNIALQGNPICDTSTLEGQLNWFTLATRCLDSQDGDANRNEVALNTQIHYTVSHQDPQLGGCCFYKVTKCPSRLMKRHLFLNRVCGKSNENAAPSDVSDSELQPTEQEMPDGTGDNFSATERGDIYSTATVPTEEATVLTEEASSRDVSEGQVTQEGERRPHGVEDASEDSNQCHEDEQGRVVCQGEGLGEDQEHVENSDHEEDTEGEKPKVPLWKRNFNVTFPQALTALLVLLIFLFVLVYVLRKCLRTESPSLPSAEIRCAEVYWANKD